MNQSTLSDRLDDLARREDAAAPTPEEELEAWLKRPWPQMSRRSLEQDADDSPAAMELP